LTFSHKLNEYKTLDDLFLGVKKDTITVGSDEGAIEINKFEKDGITQGEKVTKENLRGYRVFFSYFKGPNQINHTIYAPVKSDPQKVYAKIVKEIFRKEGSKVSSV